MKVRKAKKVHSCNHCNTCIKIGEKYAETFLIIEGYHQRIRRHISCYKEWDQEQFEKSTDVAQGFTPLSDFG